MFSSNATQVSDAAYIEDVFSTWLYTGTGTTQTINNGIDLAGKGGLIWFKSRSAATDHILYDTARGVSPFIESNTADAQGSGAGLTSFTSTGFTFATLPAINTNAATYASWTFREQPRFFDIVTYTGNGANRTIAHSLGSVPGCIMVKRLDTTGDWHVYHRITGNDRITYLNSTSDSVSSSTSWNNTTPTATEFSLGTNAAVNASGGTYVAYLFAHDAGGFGATGADNVISCGSYTGNGSATGPVVTLGYEPQWLLIKRSLGGTGDWNLIDNMRGFFVGGGDKELNPNFANAESTATLVTPTATGFELNTADTNYNATGSTYIYIVIRRGPMRTPTSGAQVFGLNARTGTGANATVTGVQTADAALIKNRGSAVASLFSSRLTNIGYLVTSSDAVEATATSTILQNNPWEVMNGVRVGTTSSITNASANTFINYLFRRAPGFFDVVCRAGTGTVQAAVSHNLAVAPELIIGKVRSNIRDWAVYFGQTNRYLNLNSNLAQQTDAAFMTSVSATNFVTGTSGLFNENAENFIYYLFASCSGVSKVGSFTGTGATQTINCGFAAGARFVLIKRTDSTGEWYVWDAARGIVAANDPYLLLNSAAAEVTTTDWVDTAASGFELSNAAGNLVNTNGASYIFLSVS